MRHDLTSGGIARRLLLFAGPMIAGNLLQQVYNITDTFIVGRYLGRDALAAVGGTYTLTTFLYSILIGLCMGCGAVVSYYCGEGNDTGMKRNIRTSFAVIGIASAAVEIVVFSASETILMLLKIPDSIAAMTDEYLKIITVGIFFVFLYNFYAYLLRALGNSVVPLCFLGISSVCNIVLDVVFVVPLGFGVKGAAYATLIAQVVSGIGLALYPAAREPALRFRMSEIRLERAAVLEVLYQSGASSIQQSVMNFGILMVQGLVNSFGTTVMAAFTVAVKIDTLAYMPAQEFGNAFSLFVSQNYGAKKTERIRSGTKIAFGISAGFCAAVSLFVIIFSQNLMKIFVAADETETIRIGAQYLVTEGAFYIGIGLLFLLYGYFRGVNRPEISLVLTVISLGTRVLLAYLLSANQVIGVRGIWAAIPIGWFLADLAGCAFIKRYFRSMKYAEQEK